jgi:LacI family transcriptional regulator
MAQPGTARGAGSRPGRARPRSVSVKDVAATAGVSIGTVSNVLNRPDRVSAGTRAKVEAAMSELGFVRNESARQLRAGRSSAVAYVMLDATNPFFTDVARGIELTAEKADLSVFICNSGNRPEREHAYLDRLEQQRVQGILITPIDPADPMLAEVAARGIPVVLVDRTSDVGRHCSVAVDDVSGGEIAARHLLELGHERIAFVGGPASLGQVRERLDGARRAVASAGLPQDRLTVLVSAELTVAEGRHAGQLLAGLPASQRPTGAVCANDMVALGLLQQCVTLGLRVPDDLAIVGYDDIDFAAAATVPLTSVRQPRLQLGETAADLLIDEASNPDHQHRQVVFTPELVVRGSTRRPV